MPEPAGMSLRLSSRCGAYAGVDPGDGCLSHLFIAPGVSTTRSLRGLIPEPQCEEIWLGFRKVRP